jgi:hypothetical protein
MRFTASLRHSGNFNMTTTKKEKREMTAVHLPTKLKTELKREAASFGRSLSAHIFITLRDRKETK